jgi:hydroxymethylglutaryl-CoA lyase
MIIEKGSVFVQEVGLRDGLQNEPRSLSPEARAGLIESLVEAGLSRVQIGSFVSPRRVPQMLGTHLVWRLLKKNPGTRYTVLVLNEDGLTRAIAEKIPHVEVYVSASQTHSMKNSGIPREKALLNATRMIETAVSHGLGVTAGVMCAFGCFYEGPVAIESVLRIVRQFEERHPTEICIADTTGMGQPQQVKEMVSTLQQITGLERINIHFHDTWGFGYSNLQTALEAGVRKYDTSVGGLGGCPFIPDAEGNISTERTVEILESSGFSTGVNQDKIIAIRNRLETLLGKKLPIQKKSVAAQNS